MAYKAFVVGANTLGLKFAEQDAQKLSKSLQQHNYQVIIPGSDKSILQSAFESMLADSAQTDTLLLYFSGHGLMVNGDLQFLLTNDTTPSILLNKLNINRWLEDFSKCRASNKLVILDCCHALQGIIDLQFTFSNPYQILAASDRLEKSIEVDALESGFLTYYLRQALNNPPEEVLDERTNFSILKLHLWLTKETQKYNNNEAIKIKAPTPKLFGPHIDFALAVLPDKWVKDFDLLLKNLETHVQLQIERYARHKYIKKLYVRRKLQTYFADFYAEETEIAQKIKSRISEQITFSQRKLIQLEKLITATRHAFDELKAQYSSLFNSLDILTNELNASDKAKDSISTIVLGSIYAQIDEIISLITIAEQKLGDIQEKTISLSPTAFVREQERHRELKNIIQITVDYIENSSVYKNDDQYAIGKISEKVISAFEAKKHDLSQKLQQEIDQAKQEIKLKSKSDKETDIEHVAKLNNKIQHLQDEYQKTSDMRNKYKTKHLSTLDKVKRWQHEFVEIISSCHRIISELDKAHKHCLLIIDRAGGGKTNLSCDLALNSVLQSPTILLFGKENYESRDSLISHIKKIISDAIGKDIESSLITLESLLENKGLFLNIYIDGINECRKIPEFGSAINSFLEWSSNYRIRVMMTCRNIYWSFFESETWFPFIYQEFTDQLYDFTDQEYEQALPLYLNHFYIKCELQKDALIQHPLVLRFFCEAYGNPGGPWIDLGPISDIRLKDLFYVYLEKKTENIGKSLGHRDGSEPEKFLLDLVN